MDRNIKKGKRGAPSKYESSLKRKVIQKLYSGTITRGDFCRKYNLGSHSVVQGFERWCEAEQRQMLSSMPMLSDKELECTVIASREDRPFW
jgi:hypothetical protein